MLVLIGKNIPAKQLLTAFQELASNGNTPPDSKPGHPDGWGICGYQNKTSFITKSTLNAANDSLYHTIVSQIGNDFSGILLAHLRKISTGQVILEHTHPFVEQTYSFMHNGTIIYPQLQGSDSLKYCSNLINHSPNGDFLIGYRWIKQNLIQDHIRWTSLNSFIASDHAIWGIRSFTCNDEYYSLYYTTNTPSYIAFCSEKLRSVSWNLIAKDCVFSLRYPTNSLHFNQI